MADRRAVLVALAADAASLVLFAALGRRSHDETGSVVGGAFSTAAPFLLALVAGWLIVRAWRSPMAWRTGAVLWPVTVMVGMVLRRTVFDRGTAAAFVVVATLFVGLFLVGWRLIARQTIRR